MTVLAPDPGIDPAICRGTCGDRDGRIKPGHDNGCVVCFNAGCNANRPKC